LGFLILFKIFNKKITYLYKKTKKLKASITQKIPLMAALKMADYLILVSLMKIMGLS